MNRFHRLFALVVLALVAVAGVAWAAQEAPAPEAAEAQVAPEAAPSDATIAEEAPAELGDLFVDPVEMNCCTIDCRSAYVNCRTGCSDQACYNQCESQFNTCMSFC